MVHLNANTPQSIKRIERIQELLRSDAMTLQEIADAVFISKRYARDYIIYLQEIGSIYIADFRKGNLPGNCRHYLAMYRWGSGVNAVSPMDEKIELDQDMEERLDRVAAIKKAKAIKPFRDWSAAWIPTRGNS